MVAGKSEDTALGAAHSRFLESLPRRAIELRGAIALLTATPAAEGPREDMRRRLHTLYASAVVFRNEPLSEAVKAGIDCLDAAREEKRGLNASELEALARLVRSIPEMGGDKAGAAARSQQPSSLKPEASPPRTSATFAVARPSAAPSGASGAPIGAQIVPVLAQQPAPADLKPVLASVAAPAKLALAPEKGAGRTPLLQRVLAVLVLCPVEEREGLRGLWTGDCLEPVFVTSVREALDSARDSTPDVVLADERLARSGNLLEVMRNDARIDFVPVVLLGSPDPEDAGLVSDADGRLARPFELHQLLYTVGRVTGTLLEPEGTLGRLSGQLTLREIADSVADEIRHGIWDAAQTGREERISLGEGAEVLAAAWGAIARVRSVITQQSQGRVQFGAHGARTTPALLTVGGADKSSTALAQTLPAQGLRGRRILVADDDEAVLNLFADLFSQQGATVLLARDGDEALRFARRERPDLVLSDILMPGLDGFGLCRAFKRDPLLTNVPVLLLSWKEDLLVRMRELSVGASGYLQKEAPFAEILRTVHDTLKPRTRLEEQLEGPSEVRGNLEGTGVVPLLRSVRRIRPDARVTLRDAWNFFECELREGRLSQLTRTASDGSFVRGERALPHLLGASVGRYSVSVAQTPLKFAFEGSLDEVLARGAEALGAELDALSYPRLKNVARVVFDEDAQVALSEHSPAAMRAVVERLHKGERPEALVADGTLGCELLEAVLLDMGRRGAIREVQGDQGEDLVVEARAARAEQAVPSFTTPVSMLPAPTTPVSMLPAPTTPVSMLPAPSVQASTPPASSGPSESQVAFVAEAKPKAAEPPLSPELFADFTPSTDDRQKLELAAQNPAAVAPVSAQAPASVEIELDAQPSAASASAQGLQSLQAQARVTRDSGAVILGSASSSQGRAAQATAQVPDEAAEQELADRRRSRSALIGWLAALLGLFAVAFLAERMLEPEVSSDHLEAIGGSQEAQAGSEPAQAVPQFATTANESEKGGTVSPALVVPEDSGFQIYSGILEPGLVTSEDQGLLVVEASAGFGRAELFVDQKKVGALPAKVALSEGIHELAIESGDAVRYRFVFARPGKTWVLRKP